MNFSYLKEDFLKNHNNRAIQIIQKIQTYSKYNNISYQQAIILLSASYNSIYDKVILDICKNYCINYKKIDFHKVEACSNVQSCMTNFQKPFQQKKNINQIPKMSKYHFINNIKNLNINPARILIFSNINFPKENINLLNIKDDDLLVFLNTSVPIKYFLNHKNKIIFCRWSDKGYFGLKDLQYIDCNKYGIDGPDNCISQQEFQEIKNSYSQQFYARSEVIYKNSLLPYHKMRQGPTTGWAVQKLLSIRYPNAKIELVNFFPLEDHSTPQFTGHDWVFQKNYYLNSTIKIYDLRETIQAIYVVDNNINYQNLCKLSIKSLKYFNPNCHVTIVSKQPIDLGQDNVVINNLNGFKELHKSADDRITNAAYLKLFLTRLPYDKCIFLDCDVLILKSIYNFYLQEIEYMGLTESYSFSKAQAAELLHEKYYLSGMMLLNLKNLRKIEFQQKCIEYSNWIDINKFKYWQHEETILNNYFYFYITDIDIKYNYCLNREYKHPVKQEDIVIMHFVGDDKSKMQQKYDALIENKN